MSNYTILHDATLELRRRIHAALSAAADADLNLSTPESDITLSPPSTNMPGSPLLSLYLYHVEASNDLRNQPRLAAGDTGLRFPPEALHVHYLITPLDDDERLNQLMLGRVIQFFHDEPFLDSLNGAPLDDSFGGNSNQLRLSLEKLSLEQLSQVWSALDVGYRVSLSYLLRVVTIDTAQAVSAAHRVIDAHMAVGLKE
ncbi:MAG: DUF4255 domain-containing protein [Anaerolineales bacterium]|nr:DUF4255 domain-containing protein [Anaerolineales bacterium]